MNDRCPCSAVAILPNKKLSLEFTIAFPVDKTPVDKDNPIGILFDRSRLAEVVQVGAFLFSRFDRAVQLAEEEDGNLKIHCQTLRRFRVHRHLLLPNNTLRRRLEELQVINEDHVEPASHLESSAL